MSQGRTYDLSNGARLTISFEGNFLTPNNQEYEAMKKLLDVLDLLRVPIKAKPETQSSETRAKEETV